MEGRGACWRSTEVGWATRRPDGGSISGWRGRSFDVAEATEDSDTGTDDGAQGEPTTGEQDGDPTRERLVGGVEGKPGGGLSRRAGGSGGWKPGPAGADTMTLDRGSTREKLEGFSTRTQGSATGKLGGELAAGKPGGKLAAGKPGGSLASGRLETASTEGMGQQKPGGGPTTGK